MISVIVPVYNVENVLHYCVESILNQSYTDFELILIDDGSTDKSGFICDQYAEKDKRVHVIHKKNGGVSSARNVGLDNAKGEYICFVDSDDRLKLEFLMVMIDTLKSENAEIVVCGYQVVSKDKVVENRSFHDNGIDIVSRENIYSLVGHTLYSASWCKLFRHDIINNQHIRFLEDLTLGEDMVFNFMYTDYITSICVLNRTLYIYNIDNSDSLLRKYRKDLLTDVQKLDRHLSSYLEKWNVDNYSLNSYINDCYYQYENILYNTFSAENEDSFLVKIKFNNAVIRSKEFQNIYSSFSVKIKLFQRVAYSVKNYFPIYLYSVLRNVLKK